MKNKLILGVTGGSGTGKSTVLGILKTLGFYVILGDEVARKIVLPGKEALSEIKKHFGSGIIAPDGTLIRKALGDIVFSDKNELEVLNSITHKYIKKEIINEIENTESSRIAVEASELFKGGLGEISSFTLAVLADKNIRINRIIARDLLTRTQAEHRINSQQPDSYYKELCDYVLYNNGKIEDVYENIIKIVNDMETINAQKI